MLINFNVEKLNTLLYNFYELTGLTISVWDAQFNQLSFQPVKMREFCRVIKETAKGKQRCFLCDKKLCIECAKTGKPITHYCHAGLVDTAIPIKFKDTVLGYILFGQVVGEKDEHVETRLNQMGKELKLDPALLKNLYDELETFNTEKINAAANILQTATRYLWLSEYIEIGYNTQASQIDDFIRKNIDKDLSLKTLCTEFCISKNKLYEISYESFGASIGEYIANVRIEEAKRLLTSTDYQVSEIGEMVGVYDYNYFIKFFKSQVGTTPLKYRKNFPFNLHENK